MCDDDEEDGGKQRLCHLSLTSTFDGFPLVVVRLFLVGRRFPRELQLLLRCRRPILSLSLARRLCASAAAASFFVCGRAAQLGRGTNETTAARLLPIRSCDHASELTLLRPEAVTHTCTQAEREGFWHKALVRAKRPNILLPFIP